MDRDQARQIQALHRAIELDPLFVTREFIGEHPWSAQSDILSSIRVNKVTTVRSCHDVGKSYTASRAALDFLTTYEDSIVVTTAPTFRQVEHVIWREIRGAHRKARVPFGGKMLKTRLDFSEEWYAIGISTNDPDRFQGFHAKSGHILIIVDEAAGVSDAVFTAIDALMTTQGARLLLIGNPTSLSGRFYDSHHKDGMSTKRIHISCFDTPNFVNNGIRNIRDLKIVKMENVEITHPYLITPEWALEMINRHGENNPIVQSRVFGQFPSAQANTLIPLNFIENAVALRKELDDTNNPNDSLKVRAIKLAARKAFLGRPSASADPARYGDDKTVITEREGGYVHDQIVHGKENTAQTAGRLKLLGAQDWISIDTDGVGGGVADILEDDGYTNIIQIMNNAKAYEEEGAKSLRGLRFANLRSQLYYHFAELVKKGEVALPDDPDLHAELAVMKFAVTRQGIAVQSKDDIKKDLNRSPDKADSIVYAFASDFMAQDTTKVKAAVGKRTSGLYNKAKDF